MTFLVAVLAFIAGAVTTFLVMPAVAKRHVRRHHPALLSATQNIPPALLEALSASIAVMQDSDSNGVMGVGFRDHFVIVSDTTATCSCGGMFAGLDQSDLESKVDAHFQSVATEES